MEKFDRIDLSLTKNEPASKWMVSLTWLWITGFRDDFYFTFIFRIGWMSMVVDIFIRLNFSSVLLHMRNIFLLLFITSIFYISGRWILPLFEFLSRIENNVTLFILHQRIWWWSSSKLFVTKTFILMGYFDFHRCFS